MFWISELFLLPNTVDVPDDEHFWRWKTKDFRYLVIGIFDGMKNTVLPTAITWSPNWKFEEFLERAATFEWFGVRGFTVLHQGGHDLHERRRPLARGPGPGASKRRGASEAARHSITGPEQNLSTIKIWQIPDDQLNFDWALRGFARESNDLRSPEVRAATVIVIIKSCNISCGIMESAHERQNRGGSRRKLTH